MRLAAIILLLLFSCSSGPMFKEKIIICGVCKNVEKALPATIQALEEIGAHFRDYRIFIYENNSTDKTAEILRKWSEKNRRVQVTCEVIPAEVLLQMAKAHTKENTPFRPEMIARARNIVLQQAMVPELDGYPYLLMVDMDFKKWDIAGILSSFTEKGEWDALCANGVDRNGCFYDRYAFRSEKRPFGPELLGERWWHDSQKAYIRAKKEKGLMPVYSAFGGAAVYKREAILGCRYAGTVTADLERVVQRFIQDHPDHPEVLKYKNREEENVTLLSPEGIRWLWNCGGIGYATCCEHVTFHAAMREKGNSKIFINPEMRMVYE